MFVDEFLAFSIVNIIPKKTRKLKTLLEKIHNCARIHNKYSLSLARSLLQHKYIQCQKKYTTISKKGKSKSKQNPALKIL